MWIAARIAVVFAALYARWRLRRRVVQPTGRQWGVAFTVVRERRGRSPHTTVGVPLESRVLFRVAREDRYSRWFEKLGLAPEMRTGHGDFDKKLKSIADHRFFGMLLRKEKAVRAMLLGLAEIGADCVYADGRVLWVRFSGETPVEKHFPDVVALKRMLTPLENAVPSRYLDLTVWRAVVVETVLLGTFGYATVSAALESMGTKSVYLSHWLLVFPAIVTGILLSALLLGLTYLLTWKAPRVGALRTEALAVCFFVLPLGGFSLASQANRWLDNGPALQASAEVAHKERSPGNSKFYVHLKKTRAPASLDTPVPGRLEVSPTFFKQTRAGTKVRLTVGRGRFGAPWIRAVRAVPP
jgi:hypothetical protein